MASEAESPDSSALRQRSPSIAEDDGTQLDRNKSDSVSDYLLPNCTI